MEDMLCALDTRCVTFSCAERQSCVYTRTIRSTPSLSNAEQPHFPQRRDTGRIRGEIGRLGSAGILFRVEEGQTDSRVHHLT